MLNEMKKQSIKKTLIPSIVVIILGAVLLFFSVSDIAKMTVSAVNLYDLADDEIKDQYVDCDIDWVYGSFAERYTRTDSGVERTEAQYYVIPVGTESYMAIKVPASRISEMDAQVDLTYDLLNGDIDSMDTFYHVKGMINELEDEEEELLIEFFEDSGFSSSEIRRYVLPYVLEEGEGSMGGSFISWAMFIGGLLLVLYGIYSLVMAYTGGYQNKVKKFISTQGSYSQEIVDADYQSAARFDQLYLGRKYCYYQNGRKHEILPIDSILWIYQQVTTHRTNGIKTGTTYAVMIYTSESKKAITLGMSKDKVTEVLEYCHTHYPHMVIGFSQELQKCFKKDRAAFLNIAYNPAKAAEATSAWDNDSNYNTNDSTGAADTTKDNNTNA